MEDLLPLFLREASGRLEEIENLGARISTDQEAGRLVRRELHTLKGSSRMMGLSDLADLCHKAEDLVDENPEDHRKFADLIEEIRHALDRLRSSSTEKENANTDGEPAADEGPVASPVEDELRIPVRLLDSLSDRSIRMRVLAKESVTLIENLYSLARTAEYSVSQARHAQVLASLATRLRRLAIITERTQRRFEAMVESQFRDLRTQQVQPVRPFLKQLARHALSLGKSQGKELSVDVDAQDCGLDRRIMNALRESLIHLVRNAVDHGLNEGPGRQNEPEGARIVLRAAGSGDRIRIEVEDNGKGIDRRAVLQTALRKGLVTAEQAEDLPGSVLLSFLFQPGFTTRKSVGNVSGRGIGLDVVAAAVERVGGEIWIESEVEKGTRFVVELPVLHLAERVLVVDAASYRIGIPRALVRSFGRKKGVNGQHSETGTDQLDLRSLWGSKPSENATIIEIETGGLTMEIVVDDVIGEEDVFLKPWPAFDQSAGWIDGLALLRDGHPIAVADIYRLYLDRQRQADKSGDTARENRKVHVLLVDDSEITREMLRRTLVEGGIDVHALSSGEAALWYLENHHVDCLLTDIEMPAMDGLELTRRIRATRHLAQLPVILISTRNSSEDRLEGLNAGADAYLGKQTLNIDDLLGMVYRFGLTQ